MQSNQLLKILIFPCIYILIVLTVGCINNSDSISFSTQNSPDSPKNDYLSVIKQYKDVHLYNDTILFGFRIGMKTLELEEHLKSLIKQGTIVRQNNKLFGLIPTDEYSADDKNNVHHFVTELTFHLNQDGTSLKSIYATLYGPRFIDVPSKKRLKSNYEESAIEAYNRVNQDISTEDKIYIGRIPGLLLDIYRLKYGYESHVLPSSFDDKMYLWVNQGRVIEVDVKSDNEKLSEDYASTAIPISNNDFSELVYLGFIRYTSIPDAIRVEEKINEIIPSLQKYADSLLENQNLEKEQKEIERANKSGV